MKLTPEQQEDARSTFEESMSKYWDPQKDYLLSPDGSGYADQSLNGMWIGWLHCLDSMKSVEDESIELSLLMHPATELRQIRSYSRCFTKAFDLHEPIFVLRAQDVTAYKCVAQWLHLNMGRLTEGHPKIIAAKATMKLMMSFGPQKLPD